SQPPPGPAPSRAGPALPAGKSLEDPGDDTVPAAGPPVPLPPAARQRPRPTPDLALSPSPARINGILRRRGAGGQAARRQVRGPGWGRGGLSVLRGGDQSLPSSLAVPELHTSLALAEEGRAAARQDFDSQRATQELLATSFLARCSVENKAATGMNIPREQPLYQGLVSLQVPVEEVLSSALQEKLALVRTQPEPRKVRVPGMAPDLLMFYEPSELFAETPYLGVEGLPPLRLQPHGRPPTAAFLMFRKLQQWDA
uniref:Protein phosphatase 1 regulatory subunit 35 n=1 Tax=Pelusios castaneus TaxID=367368 RepID=A0A8C8RIP9_9SAUR